MARHGRAGPFGIRLARGKRLLCEAMNGTAANRASRPVLLFVVALVIAALYVAREFLVPLALAVLISFLLAPLAGRLERWKIGRVPSVLTAGAVGLHGIRRNALILRWP